MNEKEYLSRRSAARPTDGGDDLAEENGDFSGKISHLDKPMTIWKVAE
jgi:hypothetical protein